MLKKFYLSILLVLTIGLAACDNSIVHATVISDMTSYANSDEELSQYLSTLDYKKDSKKEKTFYVQGSVDEEFDGLSEQQKYDFLIKLEKTMQKKNSKHTKDNVFTCGDEKCNIEEVQLNTLEHRYKMVYHPNSSSNVLEIDDDIYDPEEVNNNDSESILSDESLSEYDDSTDVSAITGYDWVDMTDEEKLTVVNQALSNLSESGDFEIKASSDWFIDALNAYWDGRPTNDKLTEIMSLSGVGGQVIVKVQ
ncbi:hypothetical protein POL82_03160 [Priestia aryabhattai]|uniref:hypothetical protein n=1 Tax=Priestia aryabhattai TaxID=412384 RepID=UPI00234F4111|nr:hypothetical protein [Priestia aryabhattai]MDC7762465.1 hypothetical protein [Priestia aryabhattai]